MAQIIECEEFDDTREQYFNVNCLQDLFEKVQPHLILSFLKDILVVLFNRLQDLLDKVQPHLILSFLRDIGLFNHF